jgi:Protein of unknown function (DUF4239)
MSNWLFALPVLWMSVVILAAIYLATAALYLLVTALAVGEWARAFRAISPGVLPPMAIIFALLVGFLSAQVWSDTDRASTAVNNEASSLRAVVLLASAFPGEPETRIHDLIRRHIEDVVTQEWPAMARGEATLTIVPARLAEALRLAFSLDPQNQGQMAAQREMVSSLQSALEVRRQRIILSRASINWVKWSVLLLQAALTLAAISMIHADNRLTNRIIMGIFATGVAVAVIMIAAHDRPFTGEISVQPAVLLQVMPEAASG